jgi:hypothetical protein
MCREVAPEAYKAVDARENGWTKDVLEPQMSESRPATPRKALRASINRRWLHQDGDRPHLKPPRWTLVPP